MSKIISMSVWGSNPQYCLGAIKNAQIAKELMSDWKCRIFIDNTVPIQYQEELFGMDNVEVADIENDNLYGMFWRFYSMFQNYEDIVISRDSDSRLSEREIKCLNEWIKSDKKFSIIRDHERHYDWPILGGMWGMKGKLDDSIINIMETYAKNHTYAIDQVFLRDIIWPLAKDNCLVHGFREVQWMKETRNLNFIGQGYDENDNPIYGEESSGEKIR